MGSDDDVRADVDIYLLLSLCNRPLTDTKIAFKLRVGTLHLEEKQKERKGKEGEVKRENDMLEGESWMMMAS